MLSFNSLPFTCFALTTVLLVLPGCKIEIHVPQQGGSVVSSDGAYTCEAGQTCMIDVVDLFFDQTFIAQPDHGYTFSRWKENDSFLCGGDKEPCRLSTASFEGSDALMSILESDEVFFLQPRFAWTPYCPDPGLVVSPGP